MTFWTMVAEDPDTLLDVVDRHRDPSSFGRAVTLAWTRAQVQLRHLGASPAEAADFQRLAGMLIRADARLRAPATAMRSGAAPQSALWRYGISGDLPIVLFRIEETEDAPRLHEVLAAHHYLRVQHLAFDLVILNDRAASYIRELHGLIEAALSGAGARAGQDGREGANGGKVHLLRSDQLTSDAMTMLLAASSVILAASRGSLGQQIDLVSDTAATPSVAVPATLTAPASPSLPPTARPQDVSPRTAEEFDTSTLEFFSGTGGFAGDGREYVVVLQGGHVWSENSRETQLTPWSNDPVCDPAGEAIWLHDLDTGDTWTPTALPIRDGGLYVARHGFGYSRFEHTAHGIAVALTQFVPTEDPVRLSRPTLHNTSARPRRLSVTAYAESVLGPSRGATLRHVLTGRDAETGAIFASNPFSTAFAGRVAFADLGALTDSRSADRAEVLGLGGAWRPLPASARRRFRD